MNIRNDLMTSATHSYPADKPYPAYAPIPEWCRISGMGRTKAYEAVGAGHLRAVKLGARTLIDIRHGLAWLDSLPPAKNHAPSAKHPRQAA